MGRLRTLLIAAGAAATLAAPAGSEGRPPRGFFGVTPQAPVASADVARMAEGRVGTLRHPLGWAQIDPGPPLDLPLAYAYDWRSFDPVVEHAARNGVELLPVAYGTPRWVASLEGCHVRCSNHGPSSPTALEAWARFLRAAVDRYGPGGEFWLLHPELPYAPIRLWQLWNEPNLHGFWRPRPAPGAYGRLLAAGADAIKAEDPGAKVVLGGLLGSTPGPPNIHAWDFLRALYADPEARRSFDLVALHPYGARLRSVRSQVHQMREQILRAGDRRRGLWITEIGWASGGNRSHPLSRRPVDQARMLRRTFELFLERRRRWRIRHVGWFAWRDTAPERTSCAWCARSGLFRLPRLAPKPAWRAYVRFSGGR